MKKRPFREGFLAVLTLLYLSGAVCAAASGSAAADSRSGVVRVVTLYEADVYDLESEEYVGTVNGYSGGSAFGVGTAGRETDVFITNRHVVTQEDGPMELQGDTYYLAYRISGYYILQDSFAYHTDTFTLDTSRAIPCTVTYVGQSEDADVAVLKAAEPVPGRMALPLLGDEDDLQVAAQVSSLGYPGASDQATSEGYLLADVDDVTVNSGVISRFYDSVSAVDTNSGALTGRLIQHNAVINGGNSGGPLLDEHGAVVGINTYTYHGGSQAVSNSYYALRIRYAKEALDTLGISYDLYTAGPSPLVVGVAVGAAVAVVAVILAVALRRRSRSVAPGGGTATAPTAAELRLQGQSGVFAGRRFSISGQVRIGRSPDGNDLVYPDDTPGISGRHCTVALSGGQVVLTDLGSSYGTFLSGGRRLTPNQGVTLKPGDRFYLGSERESFVITGKGGSLT